VCNPRKMAVPKDGSKSDRIDARKLAEPLYMNKLKPVYHGEHGLRTMNQRARRYLTITKDLTRVSLRPSLPGLRRRLRLQALTGESQLHLSGHQQDSRRNSARPEPPRGAGSLDLTPRLTLLPRRIAVQGLFERDQILSGDAHGDPDDSPDNFRFGGVAERPHFLRRIRMRNQRQHTVFDLAPPARIAFSDIHEIDRPPELRLATVFLRRPFLDPRLLGVDLHEGTGRNQGRHCLTGDASSQNSAPPS